MARTASRPDTFQMKSGHKSFLLREPKRVLIERAGRTDVNYQDLCGDALA